MDTNGKLAVAAHLVIARLPPNKLGATKLNKILWFADCEFYRRHARTLTGEMEYVRKDNGPCPPRIAEVLADLERRGVIVEARRSLAKFVRREFTSLVDPDVESLTAEEVDVLLAIALEFADLTASEVSNLSHTAQWRATPNNGRMSVAAGAVRVVESTPELIDWAKAAFAAE